MAININKKTAPSGQLSAFSRMKNIIENASCHAEVAGDELMVNSVSKLLPSSIKRRIDRTVFEVEHEVRKLKVDESKRDACKAQR